MCKATKNPRGFLDRIERLGKFGTAFTAKLDGKSIEIYIAGFLKAKFKAAGLDERVSDVLTKFVGREVEHWIKQGFHFMEEFQK